VDRKQFSEVVAEQGARVAAVARAGPLAGRVPHMRRWRLADVVAHLGGVHRWAAGIVTTRRLETGHRRGRERGDALIAWFEAGLAELVSALAGADLDAACPNFSPGSPATVEFWARRQAHETTVHRWDAEAAAGLLTPIDPELATDGIDEMLNVFRRTRGGQPLDAPLRLVTSDTGTGWRVAPAGRPGRVEIAAGDSAAGAAAATVRAPAQALLLAVWGRCRIDEPAFQVTGRAELAWAFLPGPG
jgi:uncharacterized protein (TIGR03083 family)